jgi:monoamine oxidase
MIETPFEKAMSTADQLLQPGSYQSGVTRREFLVGAGAVAVGSELSIASARSAEFSRDYDVIVIGGGFCGVSAARECKRAGLRPLILEARNRLGGRTFSADFNGHPTDMGGTWVHWSQPYVWTEIRRSGLQLRETPGASADKWIVHTSSGHIVTLSYAQIGARFESAVAAYMGDSRSLLPLPHDPFGSDEYRKVDGISSAERLAAMKNKIPPLYQDLVDGYMAAQGHNYSEQFAWLEMVRWFALPGHNITDMNDATGRFHFKDGTVALLNAIQSETRPDVRLGSPVKRVVQDATGVSVQTAAGDELRGRAVISTVPLNVLKDLEWQPGLSEAQLNASRLGHAGAGTKLHMLLEGDYGSINCIAPSHKALNYVSTERVADGYTHLVGFGPSRNLLDVNDSDSVQDAVRLFIPDAKVVKTFGYEWVLDPYSRGTWCTLRPGMWSGYLHELQQPRGRVIFASADWANGWRGFIDGAIEQGLEAGKRVREMLA